MRALAIACVLALAAFGCKGKEETPTTETTPAATTAAATPTTPANTAPADTNAAIDNADIPTEEDFEEEAATDINVDNLNDELDKLEKDIGG